MAGWHHQLDAHEFGWTPGVGDGQGGLACCNSWGCKESDTTERLNWTELNWLKSWSLSPLSNFRTFSSLQEVPYPLVISLDSFYLYPLEPIHPISYKFVYSGLSNKWNHILCITVCFSICLLTDLQLFPVWGHYD